MTSSEARKALEEAGLKNVTIREPEGRNTILSFCIGGKKIQIEPDFDIIEGSFLDVYVEDEPSS